MKELLAATLLVHMLFAPVIAQDAKQLCKEDIILKKLVDLQKSINGIAAMHQDVGKNKSDINEIREEIKKLRIEINALKPRVTPKAEEKPKKKDDAKKTSHNPPEVQYGKIKFINTYHLPYAVTVNGEEHAVKAGGTTIVDYIMPGEFTYQVIGITDLRKRNLSAKETFTISISPPPDPTPKNYTKR